MGVTDNKKLVETTFTDMSLFLDTLSDDIRWTVMGTTVFSDTYRGKQDVMDRLVRPLGTQLVSFGSESIQNVVAEGDYVVVQSQVQDRMTKTGRPYNNTYCIVMRIVDGKVTELDEYCDTELITSAFGGK
jgi:ketosteroid isomerase-like protein